MRFCASPRNLEASGVITRGHAPDPSLWALPQKVRLSRPAMSRKGLRGLSRCMGISPVLWTVSSLRLVSRSKTAGSPFSSGRCNSRALKLMGRAQSGPRKGVSFSSGQSVVRYCNFKRFRILVHLRPCHNCKVCQAF